MYQYPTWFRGDDYVDSSISAEESSQAAAQAAENLNDALTNEMPTSSTSKEVAEDEAEVTFAHKSRRYPYQTLPKLAPLAVENFLTHAKEGYNGITFHRWFYGPN